MLWLLLWAVPWILLTWIVDSFVLIVTTKLIDEGEFSVEFVRLLLVTGAMAVLGALAVWLFKGYSPIVTLAVWVLVLRVWLGWEWDRVVFLAMVLSALRTLLGMLLLMIPPTALISFLVRIGLVTPSWVSPPEP